MTIELKKIYIPSEKIVSRKIEDTLVIVPIESGLETFNFDESVYSLDDIGKDIWERLDQKITVEQLCTDLIQKYNASLEVITEDVLALLEDLSEKGLITEYR